jgi:hypothetical protein
MMNVRQVNIPTGVISGVAMSCPSASGGKEWFGFLVQNKDGSTSIVTYWGKTNRITGGPAAKIGDSTHFKNLIQFKIKKGYVQEDEYVSGYWQSELSRILAPKAPPKLPEPVAKPAPKIFKQDLLKEYQPNKPADSTNFDF